MKEFFKPSLAKIILAIFLLLAGIYIGSGAICPPYTECISPPGLVRLVASLTLVPLAIHWFMTTNWGGFFSIIILVIFYYSLSCLAILIFERMKRKS